MIINKAGLTPTNAKFVLCLFSPCCQRLQSLGPYDSAVECSCALASPCTCEDPFHSPLKLSLKHYHQHFCNNNNKLLHQIHLCRPSSHSSTIMFQHFCNTRIISVQCRVRFKELTTLVHLLKAVAMQQSTSKLAAQLSDCSQKCSLQLLPGI